MSRELDALQGRLQHQFADPRLLQRAVTHRSFSADHNERLEFLGDSVLNLSVSSLLYQRLGSLPEGDSRRSLAQALRVAAARRLTEREAPSGGNKRPSILADAVEALIGAVYLDAGYSVAEALVHRLFKAVEINPQMQAVAKDPKTELQEWLQGRKMKVPTYRVIATLGAAHRQTFDVECEIPELGIVERGIGGSRRAGEQAAATAVLALLKARKT